MDIPAFLGSLAAASKSQFTADKRVLSFEQYLTLFTAQPHLLGRSAAQYTRNVLETHGVETVTLPGQTQTRYKLFNAPFDGGRNRLIGQEEVQQQVYRILCDFEREDRGNRLLLLHGPNGSAKTSFVQCLARAMEAYSQTQEGAVYSFNWVFPKSSYLGKRVGFEAADGTDRVQHDSYAGLAENEIAALLPGELRDHPVLLVPRQYRQELLSGLVERGLLPDGFQLPSHLVEGDLGPVSRRIFDALLTAYEGNLSRVLAHVQVERFYFSHRYRNGLVTIEPQMHVDAAMRQITMDDSYSNLPAVLRHIPMYELSGDLVNAHRGLIEFSDMLKRPLDSFKYLLGTCENGRINVGGAIVYVDTIFIGTTNDKYLNAFAQSPDFASFKGRMDLVKVPYLRNYCVEEAIYSMQVTPEAAGRHIAPYSHHLVSLWAVLTRMRRPDPEKYSEELRPAIENLTPREKADLFALGRPPEGIKPEETRDLMQQLDRLYSESKQAPDYEGSTGASPREGRAILMAAAHSEQFQCLHPVSILSEIQALLARKSIYEFLQLPPNGDYGNQEKLLAAVQAHYVSLVDNDLKQAMGLVTDADFELLFSRYAVYASAFLNKEAVVDPITHKHVPPDETFMQDLEQRFAPDEEIAVLRADFMGRVASRALDHPDEQRAFQHIFPEYFQRLRSAYYNENLAEIMRTSKWVLELLDDTPQEKEVRDRAVEVRDAFIANHGYCEHCIGPALSFMVANLA